MHREISHSDQKFESGDPLGLYFLTGFLTLLLAADLWPTLVSWLGTWGSGLPTWPNEVGGYRLALAAAIIGGARALFGSLDSLLAGKIGADLALALACLAAILLREPLVAAEVVLIGLLGECLEHFIFHRTQRALRGLVELQPRRCWRLREGNEERIRTSELQVGDRVVVKPGGRIPVDGFVESGQSTVDVSVLTGESLPQDKGPGDAVLAGSLNHTGALVITAHKVAEETLVGRVVTLTARALQDKSRLERTADHLARWFLPLVLGLACITFLAGLIIYTTGWFRPAGTPLLSLAEAARISLYPALSVLVVACPCALILATPAAVIASLGRLAGTGILIKRGSALERLGDVKVFAFDKTGTLTQGKLEIGDVVPLEGFNENSLLSLMASVEQQSEHLLARLVVDEARSRKLSLESPIDFQAFPGTGVGGTLKAGRIRIGNPRWIQEQGITIESSCQEIINHLDRSGQTVLLVALNDTIVGVLGARDTIRPEAAGCLASLRELGIERFAILTGDRMASARTVASGIATESLGQALDIQAELLPEQKADWIQNEINSERRAGPASRNAGRSQARVAMVGDGINDALALARADVSIALAVQGTDLPAEVGDIVLFGAQTSASDPGKPLQSLPFLIRLSRQMVAIIRQNILYFAFGVNFLGILLTAWLWPILLPASWFEQGPVAAVIYHQLGSLAVLLNSMRLLWFEREHSGSGLNLLTQRLNQVNDWFERWCNPDEVLHQLLHHARTLILVLAGLAAFGYFLSGINQIGPDEVGIVTRFGRPLPEELKPGLSCRWPWPIEEVYRVKPDRIQTVEVGFRSLEPDRLVSTGSAWSSQHGQDGVMRLPEEALMMTGDGNLLEVQCSLRYRISSPKTWLFDTNNGIDLLRSAAESVLRETVGSHPFSDMLTTGREGIQQEILGKLRQRLDAGSSRGIGIDLEGISLTDIHPPQEVVASYHEVTRAMEYRDRRVNEAQTAAQIQEAQETSNSLETIRKAMAVKTKTVAMTQAEAGAFRTTLETRNRLNTMAEFRLFTDTLAAVHQGKNLKKAVIDHQHQRQEMLSTQAMLTDFRLFWEAMRVALEGREKVIVDADKVPGRRHLWLLPPDLLRSSNLVAPQDRKKEDRGP